MDIVNLVANAYKSELAEANEKRILFQVQCEVYKKRIEELENELNKLKGANETQP